MTDSALRPEARYRLDRPPTLEEIAKFWGAVFDALPVNVTLRAIRKAQEPNKISAPSAF